MRIKEKESKIFIKAEGLMKNVKVHEVSKDDVKKCMEGYSYIDQNWLDTVVPKFDKVKLVECIPLYETTSRNRKKYLAKIFDTFSKEAIGKPGYLGHEDCFSQAYRTPVARYVASKTVNIEIETEKGKETRKASQLIAFISNNKDGDDLFTNIKEGIAGSQSIVADIKAMFVEENDNFYWEVHDIVAVESIDFCNPGTEGVPGAGVTAIVREQFINSEGKLENEDEDAVMEFTIENLRGSASGREVIRQLETTATEKIASEKINPLNAKISEQTTLIDTLKKEKDEMSLKVKALEVANLNLRSRYSKTELTNYRNSIVASKKTEIEAKAKETNKKADFTFVETVCETFMNLEVGSFLVSEDDENLTKSKESMKAKFESQYDEIVKLSKKLGYSQKDETVDTTLTTTSEQNKNSKTSAFNDIFSKEVVGEKK